MNVYFIDVCCKWRYKQEKNFFTAAEALNKLIKARSDAIGDVIEYMKKLPSLRRFTPRIKTVMRLLGIFLRRNPSENSTYPYITSKPSECICVNQLNDTPISKSNRYSCTGTVVDIAVNWLNPINKELKFNEKLGNQRND